MFLDKDGCMIVSNDKAAALLGLPRFSGDEPVSIDKMIRFLEFDPPAPPSGLESLPKAMALMRPGVVACAGPGGRILEIRTRVLEDGGYVRTIDDVTQSYNAARQLAGARDEAQAASRARAAFLARMSHEIRTPLHAVLGYSRLLDREALPRQAKQIAHDIREASAHLLAIVDDILDFSTIDVGRLRVEIGAVDVREMLEIARKTALVLLGYKPVEVCVHVADDVPTLVRSDRRRILQVLTNLVSNAAKFTDSGTIELRAQRVVGAGADRLLIEVRDTGCGVWPAEVPALFEAFSRAGETAHKPGAGLGLAIVREIVRGLGGEIEVESAPGKGSNFFFSIPAEAAEGADRALGAPAQDEGGGLDILVADDSRSSLRLMQLMLERRNHRVVTALNGWEAVEACARQSFDLVFLDVQMPVMDGLQAAAAVRRRETVSGRRTLISALTAQVLAEDQAAARAAGMDYILRKPFEEHELEAILKEASSRKKEALAPA
jgi:signal transduction histidine kinase/ActR/RegA family two-component response regulator